MSVTDKGGKKKQVILGISRSWKATDSDMINVQPKELEEN